MGAAPMSRSAETVSGLDRWWPLPDRPRLRQRLQAAYAGPDRGYHDLRHLAEVLEHLGELMPAGHPTRDVVLLAAWFHDAVYDGAGDDEERSARLAEEELAGAPYAGEVARLVRLTRTHRPADDDLDGELLSDADLAILAAPAERYAEYVAGVRAEHAEVTEPEFRAGRRDVLIDLLAKPTLFHTPSARERWESRALANLRAEVEQLTG